MPEEKKATGSKSSVVKKLKATAAAGAYQKQWFFEESPERMRFRDPECRCADGNLPRHGHSVCCKPVVGCNLRSKTYDQQVCPSDDRQWLSQ